MSNVDVKILITRNNRPITKREKQFCNGAIAAEEENCRIDLNKKPI